MGKDHEEGQQDSGCTMTRNGQVSSNDARRKGTRHDAPMLNIVHGINNSRRIDTDFPPTCSWLSAISLRMTRRFPATSQPTLPSGGVSVAPPGGFVVCISILAVSSCELSSSLDESSELSSELSDDVSESLESVM